MLAHNGDRFAAVFDLVEVGGAFGLEFRRGYDPSGQSLRRKKPASHPAGSKRDGRIEIPGLISNPKLQDRKQFDREASWLAANREQPDRHAGFEPTTRRDRAPRADNSRSVWLGGFRDSLRFPFALRRCTRPSFSGYHAITASTCEARFSYPQLFLREHGRQKPKFGLHFRRDRRPYPQFPGERVPDTSFEACEWPP